MKKLGLTLFLCLLCSFQLKAEEKPKVPKVGIKSFARISDNQKNMTAEICGKVEEQKKRRIIDIIADPKSKKPTPFSTISQPDGSFCILITTYMGQAIARIGNGPKTETFID